MFGLCASCVCAKRAGLLLLFSVFSLLNSAVHAAVTCDSTIYSFENTIQGWAGGVPPTYSDSGSQAAVYSMQQHATDGSYALRVAWDSTSAKSQAYYLVSGLSLDWSGKKYLNFDFYTAGSQPVTLKVALSTGLSYLWQSSTTQTVKSGSNAISIDLTSSTWATTGSNNQALTNINQVKQITIILQTTNTAYGEAFIDNIRTCTGASASSGGSASTTGSSAGTTSGGTVPPVVPIAGFVGVNGTRFSLNGCPYYVHGTNCYYLIYQSKYMVDDFFTSAVAMGVNVVRTWGAIDIGSTDGSRSNIDGQKNGIYFQYYSSSGGVKYNDGATGLQMLDYAVYAAKQNGIRLIISLVNNWAQFGGMDQYVTWFNGNYHDDFYTNANIIAAYKNYVAHVINRVNSLTGVAYKNEPAIFAWELTNELRCVGTGAKGTSSSCTSATLVSWANTMSTYIASIDSNHMIAVGDEGFYKGKSGWMYDGTTGDFEGYLGLKSISFGTVHLYPSQWNQDNSFGDGWIRDHLTSGKTANKPVILEEFGIEASKMSERNQYYQTWANTIESQDGAGDCYWMLAAHADGGSLYSDYDGYTLYDDASTASSIMKNHAINMHTKSVCAASQSTTGKSATTTGSAAEPSEAESSDHPETSTTGSSPSPSPSDDESSAESSSSPSSSTTAKSSSPSSTTASSSKGSTTGSSRASTTSPSSPTTSSPTSSSAGQENLISSATSTHLQFFTILCAFAVLLVVN